MSTVRFRLLAMLLVPSATFASAVSPPQIFEIASRSVVTVHVTQSDGSLSQGSGVTVADGFVVSNCHVLGDAEAASLRFVGRAYPARLVASARERDLCLLASPELPASAVSMGNSAELPIGSRVYAIGAPRGLELSLSDGLLSSRRSLGSHWLLQTTTPISPGSSGGGLFDESGRLIGITTLYLKESQQLNFAVPVEWVVELLRTDQSSKRPEQISGTADPVDTARIRLNELGAHLSRSDPDFDLLYPRLVEFMKVFVQSNPPETWYDAAANRWREMKAELVSRQPSAPVKAKGEALERWRLVYEDSEMSIRFDRNTVERVGHVVKVWSETKYAPPTTFGPITNVSRLLQHQIHDCASRTTAFDAATAYDANGNPLRSISPKIKSVTDIVAPESIGEAEWEAACSIVGAAEG